MARLLSGGTRQAVAALPRTEPDHRRRYRWVTYAMGHGAGNPESRMIAAERAIVRRGAGGMVDAVITSAASMQAGGASGLEHG
jgi:hypothetical protein